MTKSRGILPPRKVWSQEEIDVLRSLYPDTSTAEIAKKLGITVDRVYHKAHKMGLAKSAEFLESANSGRIQRGRSDPRMIATQFKPGQQVWNKGMKGLRIGGEETQFKPGQLPHNTSEIGAYRITKGGTLQRKISNAKGSNSKRWRGVHELVWVEANGPVPEGHICVFKPGMKTSELEEITVDKVECISFAENMRRNSYHNNYPKVIARLIQLRGAVQRKINRRMKEDGNDNTSK